MNKEKFIVEKQTGHPQDPGDVKWQLIERFIYLESAQVLAQALSQEVSYAETGLRIYDLKEDRVVWSNLKPSIISPELKRRTRLSEMNELKVEAEDQLRMKTKIAEAKMQRAKEKVEADELEKEK